MTQIKLLRLSQMICLFVVGINLLSGCGTPTRGKNELPTFPVKGVVKVDGKPTGPANLQLRSSDKSLPVVAGSVNADGTFTLITYRLNDGAPKGKFAATLVAGDPMIVAPSVEPIEVEISKANSNLVLEFKGTGKDTPHPLSIQPKIQSTSQVPGMTNMPKMPTRPISPSTDNRSPIPPR